MDDLLSTIHSLAGGQRAQEEQLRAALLQLGARVYESLGNIDIYVISKNVVFEEYDYGESRYGYLAYPGATGFIEVAYRSTEQDVEYFEHPSEGGDSYSLKRIEDCSFKWLLAISQKSVIYSFLEDMIEKLRAQHMEAETGIRLLSHALNAPIKDAETALEDAAAGLGFDDVVSEWKRAQTSLAFDPADAITRSSSLIETVCKHILHKKGEQLPSNESIQPLLQATMKALGLLPQDQASEDIRKMAGGIITVTSALGALRTHTGTAHGRGPDGRSATASQARLALNLAGVLATFLMEMSKGGDGERA